MTPQGCLNALADIAHVVVEAAVVEGDAVVVEGYVLSPVEQYCNKLDLYPKEVARILRSHLEENNEGS